MCQFSPFSPVPSMTKLRIEEYKFTSAIDYMKEINLLVKD